MAVTDVSASLLLRGNTRKDLAAAATAALGVEPTRSHEFGDPHPSKSLASVGKVTIESMWLFSEPRILSSAEDRHGIESPVRLAERFEDRAEVLSG